MPVEKIRSKAEAEELLLRLQKFYGQPVMPLGRFCKAITTWMECIVQNNTDPELSKAGFHGRDYYTFLNEMSTDIEKSNLLGRLLFAREPLRTKKCPIHKGHWSGEAMFLKPCPEKCGGTGWLPVRPEDRGFTGIIVRSAREVDGRTQLHNPETGEWQDVDDVLSRELGALEEEDEDKNGT